MKIRHGFVTNSSSSSFIIAFDNEECIETAIREAATHCFVDADEYSHMTEEEFIGYVIAWAIQGIKDSRISLEELKKVLEEEFERQAKWKLYYSSHHFWNDKGAYLQTEEYKAKAQEFISERMEEALSEVQNKSFISYPSFADEDGCIGSFLEHDFIPTLKETICHFSHH